MFETFVTRKITVRISPVEANAELEKFNGRECTLISTALTNDFTKMLLAKRFAQINSLIRTDPKNYLKKMTGYVLTNSVEFTGHMKVLSAKVYVWETNNGNKVFIIPPLHVMFMTSNNNCYVVEYPIEDLMF